MTNEEKAVEIRSKLGIYADAYYGAMEMAQWKDEQHKQDRSILCNYLKEWAQEWLIEQLTAFAQHLNKRGAFCDDLCMDFEHEAQSFIESQKKENKQ
jgi:hypothetical protein